MSTRPILVCLVSLAVACTLEVDETVFGSGVAATEFRALQSFDSIAVEGSLDVRVRAGMERGASVFGDDNLLSYVRTDVADGLLTVRVARGFRLDPTPRLEIDVESLIALAVTGSGAVMLEGVDGDSLRLSVSGSGEVRCSGRIARLVVSVVGSGDLDLRELVAAEAEIDVTGSGDVVTHATERLAASVTGSGEVTYIGDPRVEGSTVGSGRVQRAERQR